MAWFKVRKLLSLSKLQNRNYQHPSQTSQQKDLDKAFNMYMDIAKAWLIKAIKQPLLSIIED